MLLGDLVKMTNEGSNHILYGRRHISRNAIGIIVNKYLYEAGDNYSNGQDLYDVLFAGEIILSLFNSEITLV